MNNRYFKSTKEITPEIESVMVGAKGTQNPRSKKGNIIIKLKDGDENNYKCLKDWQEMTKEEAVKDFESEEWTVNILQAAKDFENLK
jgi:hypothetical protein